MSDHGEIIDRHHPHLEEASGQHLASPSGTAQGGQHQLVLPEVPGQELQRIPG
jgi:hypothetical protein